MKVDPNAALTTILARCLVEPQFQRSLSEDPDGVLRSCGLSGSLRALFTGFDFKKLELFGGLITQTQHNFLWESFPYTRTLMKRYGIELSIFSSYRQRAAVQGDLSRQARTEKFTDYLKEYLLTVIDARSYPGLSDVFLHERVQWELQDIPAMRPKRKRTSAPDIPSRCRELDRLVPVLPGNVRFQAYRYDPLEVVYALEGGDFEPSRLKRRLTGFFYRMDAAENGLSLFRTTSAAGRLFQMVDGRRSVGSILRASTSKRPKLEMRRYFVSACAGNLIELRSSR